MATCIGEKCKGTRFKTARKEKGQRVAVRCRKCGLVQPSEKAVEATEAKRGEE